MDVIIISVFKRILKRRYIDSGRYSLLSASMEAVFTSTTITNVNSAWIRSMQFQGDRIELLKTFQDLEQKTKKVSICNEIITFDSSVIKITIKKFLDRSFS